MKIALEPCEGGQIWKFNRGSPPAPDECRVRSIAPEFGAISGSAQACDGERRIQVFAAPQCARDDSVLDRDLEPLGHQGWEVATLLYSPQMIVIEFSRTRKGAASRFAAATASWIANAASLCGETDWRLPSRAELLSLWISAPPPRR